MNDPAFVRGLESFGDLPRDEERFDRRYRPLRDAVGERGPLDELHHQRLRALGVLDAVDGGDVRMIQRGKNFGLALVAASALFGAAIFATPTVNAEQQGAAPEVTFTKDIAPILQRSCQNCHRPGQVAPMSLLTYEEARPWARAMKLRTAIRDKAGAMPPWYIEKNIDIQHYKNDPSLSDEEIAKIAK